MRTHLITLWQHRQEFMPKKLYRESPLMPSKPSIICKGYIYFPPEHKEQISTFMKNDLYSALGEWKNKARTEADLCERRCTMCALTLKVGVGRSPERVLVCTDCRALQKRCAALQTEVCCQHGSAHLCRVAWVLFSEPIFLWKSLLLWNQNCLEERVRFNKPFFIIFPPLSFLFLFK